MMSKSRNLVSSLVAGSVLQALNQMLRSLGPFLLHLTPLHALCFFRKLVPLLAVSSLRSPRHLSSQSPRTCSEGFFSVV